MVNPYRVTHKTDTESKKEPATMVGSNVVASDPGPAYSKILGDKDSSTLSDKEGKHGVHTANTKKATMNSHNLAPTMVNGNSTTAPPDQGRQLIMDEISSKFTTLQIDKDGESLREDVDDEVTITLDKESTTLRESLLSSDESDKDGTGFEADVDSSDAENVPQAKLETSTVVSDKEEEDPAGNVGLIARAPPGIPTTSHHKGSWIYDTPQTDMVYVEEVNLPHKYMKPERQAVENDDRAEPPNLQFITLDNNERIFGQLWPTNFVQMPPVNGSIPSPAVFPYGSGYDPQNIAPTLPENSPMSASSGQSPPYGNESFYPEEPSYKPTFQHGSDYIQIGSPAQSNSSSSGHAFSPQTILPEIHTNFTLEPPNLEIFDRNSAEQLNPKAAPSLRPAVCRFGPDSPNQKVPSPFQPAGSPALPNSPPQYIYHTMSAPTPPYSNTGSPPIPQLVADATCSDEIPTKPMITVAQTIPTTVPLEIHQVPCGQPMYSTGDTDALFADAIAIIAHETNPVEPDQRRADEQRHKLAQGKRKRHQPIKCPELSPNPIPLLQHPGPENGRHPVHVLPKPKPLPKEDMSPNQAAKAVCRIPRDKLLFRDGDGDSTLMIFVVKEYPLTLIKALLERYKREDMIHQIINGCNNLQQTPVYMATVLNQSEVVALLIQYGADVNMQAHMKEQSARGPLHCVASKGDKFLPTLQALLTCPNANINLQNFDGYTPLHCAIRAHGSLPPNQSGEMIFCMGIMEELVRHPSTEVDGPDGKSGKTPVHYVVESKQQRLVEHLFTLILQYRPHHCLSHYVNKTSFDGSTCLHIAVGLHLADYQEEHKMLVSLLMRSGADPTIKNSSQKMPKDLAKNPEILAIVKGTTGSAKR